MKKGFVLLLAVLIAVAALAGCQRETLALDRTELTMTVGDSATLSAGDAVKVNWSSSDDKVATVSAGTVSAKAAGTAVITASLENGEQAACTVTVTDKLITGITLSAASTRVEEGKTIQLSATYAPSDASNTVLSWDSSNESVATVDAQGYVTAVSEGVAEITCRSENGIEATCTVTVGGTAELPTVIATLPPSTEQPTQAPTEEGSHKSSKPERDHQDSASSAGDDSGSYDGNNSGGFIFPDSSTRYLSESEIAATLTSRSGSPVSGSFAQDAVNEIYARNGYIFRSSAIRAYYEAQSWYRPDPNYDGSLNEIELYNIGLLSDY